MEIAELSRRRVVLELPKFPRGAQYGALNIGKMYETASPITQWKYTFSASTYTRLFEVPKKLIPGQHYFAEMIFYKNQTEDRLAIVTKMKRRFRAGKMSFVKYVY